MIFLKKIYIKNKYIIIIKYTLELLEGKKKYRMYSNGKKKKKLRQFCVFR